MNKRLLPLFGILLLLLLVLFPSASFAEGYAGAAGAFLRMGSGATALASGDAGVARAMGAEQAHYNPAGLPYAPANDVYIGYHVLSLDRSLAHLSALFQIPSIAFWGGPIRTITFNKSELSNQEPPELIYPEQLRRRAPIEYRVQDYLNALADKILSEANVRSVGSEVKSAADSATSQYISISNNSYRLGVLAPVVNELVPEVLAQNLTSRDDVIELLKARYQKVQEKPAGIALTWTHAGTDNITSRNTDGRIIGDLGYYENRFALSFGLKFHRRLSAGITVGVLYALIPDLLEDGSKALTSTTFDADVGFQYRPFLDSSAPYRLETLSLGVAAYDISAKNTWNTTGYWNLGTTKTDQYPDRYRAGFAYEPLDGVSTYLDIETDLEDIARPKGGVEFRLWGVGPSGNSSYDPGAPTVLLPSAGNGTTFTLRAGVDRDRPTFGLGLMLPLAGFGMTRLDYAYVIEPVSPEATQVISWRFRFTL